MTDQSINMESRTDIKSQYSSHCIVEFVFNFIVNVFQRKPREMDRRSPYFLHSAKKSVSITFYSLSTSCLVILNCNYCLCLTIHFIYCYYLLTSQNLVVLNNFIIIFIPLSYLMKPAFSKKNKRNFPLYTNFSIFYLNRKHLNFLCIISYVNLSFFLVKYGVKRGYVSKGK